MKSSLNRTLIAGALVLSQTLFLTPFTAFAADSSVRIAGQAVITNVASSGSITSVKRAETVQTNLDNALVAAKDRTPASVNITYVKGLPVITLGGYQVITVDGGDAKANGTTPAVLAKRWADGIRNMLRDQDSIDSYVAQLSGDYSSSAPAANRQQSVNYGGNQYAQPQPQANYPPPGGYAQQPPGGYAQQPPGGYRQGRVAYAPAGLVMQISLNTSIATQAAKAGDMIQATVSQTVMLGDSNIPAGSTIIGNITEAQAGRMLGRSGSLGIKFNRLRTPDGIETPISAHLVGGIGKYADAGSDQDDLVKGETWKGKAVQAGVRGLVGAGSGAALGTAVGAIAGGGRGAGRGAWSGTAIGGGLGVAQSVLLRKGKDVVIPSGTQLQLQLDAPVSIAGGGTAPYVGAY